MLCQIFLGKAERRIGKGDYKENLAVLHSLCLLYQETREQRYRDLALRIANEEFPKTRTSVGRSGNHYLRDALAGKEYYQFPDPRWECLHAVQGLAALYWITGEESYRKAFEHIWWSIANLERHNTGAFSTWELAVGNPYDARGIETCAVVAWTGLTIDMLRLTGNSIMADELELTFLNAVLGYQS